jgi:hypothetical protein
VITLRLEKPLDTSPDGSTIRKVKKPATIKHVDNNLRASTLNALLLLTTGTSIHANSTIYIHHSSLHKK